MSSLVLMMGLPGAGKSTLVNQLRSRRSDVFVVCPDQIRSEIFQVVFDPIVEDQVWSIASAAVEGHLRLGRTVVLDSTNLTPKRRVPWIQLAQQFGAVVGAVFVNPPIEVVRQQNRLRIGDWVVPEDVMDQKIRSLQPPTVEEGFHFIIETRSVVENVIEQVLTALDRAEGDRVSRQVFVQG